MERVLSSYEVDESSKYIKSDQNKIDVFWAKYSCQAGQNLSPLLEKWGIPYSQGFQYYVGKLPMYKQRVNIFD